MTRDTWARDHLGRIVWWRPCWRLRIEEYRGQRRAFRGHRENWRRWGDPRADTLKVWLRWWWTGMKIVLRMREKSMAVVERSVRINKERRVFMKYGADLRIQPGPWESGPWLGYAGMHYMTTTHRGEPLWAEDMGLV